MGRMASRLARPRCEIAQQVGAEPHFPGTLHDAVNTAGWHLGGVFRQKLDQHQIAGVTRPDQGQQCRVGRIAAVPVKPTIDLNGLKKRRDTSRREQRARPLARQQSTRPQGPPHSVRQHWFRSVRPVVCRLPESRPARPR